MEVEEVFILLVLILGVLLASTYKLYLPSHAGVTRLVCQLYFPVGQLGGFSTPSDLPRPQLCCSF